MAKTIRPAAATDAGVIYELMCQLEDARFDRAAYNVRYIWQLRNGAFHGLVLTEDAVVCGFINVREGARRFYEARGMCKTHVKLTMPV